VNRGEQEFSEEQKAALVDAYDAQIRSLDDRLRELFDRLQKAGALENTLVILCADHGESFYEHKKLGHAVTLYQSEIHVPLIVKAPGQTAGARVARAVELTDVAPTILDMLGLPGADGMEGMSLAAEKRKLPIVSYLGPYERSYSEHAVFSDDWKLIMRSNAGPQLFDVSADPMEAKNSVAEEAGRLAELQSLLDVYQKRTATRLQRESMVLDPETAERLESVGYGKAK
jgi:arylsulfatase A-like enzyme